MSVDIQHISKRFGQQTVLADVNLHIEAGEVVGLLGPNGAGKSTLMKILLGLWHADKGTVTVPDSHGYLAEQNPLYDDMYVREYLNFMMRLQVNTPGNIAERVEKLIERVGLSNEAHKKIRNLSKGYKQRVGLAQAMIGDPELLILDEPTTGLDPNQLEEIRSLIKTTTTTKTQTTTKTNGRMVILSTHILQEVKEMCTRVVILDHGTIKADLPIQQIDDLEALFHNTTQHN